MNIAFKGQLSVPTFNPKAAKGFEKLKLILSEKFKLRFDKVQQGFFSPPSDDAEFRLQETPNDIMKRLTCFDQTFFFKKVLRNRKNFMGVAKNADQILVQKSKPLSKSLTSLSEKDEIQAIQIFKALLKISRETKIHHVFNHVESMINLCLKTSPQLKNQVLLQLIKQSNTEKQLTSVRILQTMTVFLHIYSPDNDFLFAALKFFYKNLSQNNYTVKQNEYARYNFKKIIRKIERCPNINYMPIKYQILALMSKRKIPVPVYLSVGNSVLAKVESYETFTDIKVRIMEEFGIDTKRLLPSYFGFFEIMNFDNEVLEECPIQESQIVWDTITYWQKAKDKYKLKGIIPPSFFLMLKIKYVYECHFDDEQSIQLMFHQTYFDYFIGRIRLPIEKLGKLAACVKLLKFMDKSENNIKVCFPSWARMSIGGDILQQVIISKLENLEGQNLSEKQLKFRFLSIAQQCPLCMSLLIKLNQKLKLIMKPNNILFVQKNEIVEIIPLKRITKYKKDGQKFIFYVQGVAQKKQIQTEYASICCQFINVLPSLMKHCN